MGASSKAEGPDFAAGVGIGEVPDGATLAGRVGDEPVLLARRGDAFFAVSGACTHYGAPLHRGLIDGDRVHCPWHHACFHLRTGEALAAPAVDALKRWRVEAQNGRVFVHDVIAAPIDKPAAPQQAPRRIVIVGGGAAGFAAAEMLRRRGFSGELVMLSSDAHPPCDRPNLSKDYLAGEAPPEWIPLKGDDFYRENGIDLRLGTTAAEIKRQERCVVSSKGDSIAYDALLLATGASPIRLAGFDDAKTHALRTLTDADALIAAAAKAKRAVIIGAGFIGLETAASLRTRGLDVDLVTPAAAPLVRVLGEEVGRFVQAVHEENGVRFHFGQTAESYDGAHVRLKGGRTLAADLVVVGVGVRPNVELAERAGLAVSNGVEVDAFLRSGDAAIFAAGDIAAFPDALSRTRARIEHWVAAERQGQVAAVNMLGGAERYDEAPFFWSAHYHHTLRYVGYAPKWDRVEIDGSVKARDFTARYSLGGRLLAAVSLNRDLENLEIEQNLNTERRKAHAQA